MFLDQWTATLTEGAESAKEPLLPVIQEFKNIIEEDPQLYIMFHFGGSTHCLIFRPNVNVKFDLHRQSPGLNSVNIPFRARIAAVVK